MLCSESSSQQVVHNRLWIAVDMWRTLDLMANESQLTRNSTPILSANAKSDAIGGVVTIPNESYIAHQKARCAKTESPRSGKCGARCRGSSGLRPLVGSIRVLP
jgi:hypothetical protein